MRFHLGHMITEWSHDLQNLSEFALHARAFLGLPIPNIELYGPSASVALVVKGHSEQVSFGNLLSVLSEPQTEFRVWQANRLRREKNGGDVSRENL